MFKPILARALTCRKPGPEFINKFMLNSAEHELVNAHKYKKIK